MMIRVQKSPTADTRTCDVSQVTKDLLVNSSKIHRRDVDLGLKFFESLLESAGFTHDLDKLSDIDSFFADFREGFKEGHTSWWDKHRKINRHHLNMPDGVPDNVNLVDVIEHVVDSVMAGLARSGEVYPIKLPDELLQKAVANTQKLLEEHVQVVE